jgi:hypothetical protein
VLAPLEQIETLLEQYPHLTDAQAEMLRHGEPRPLWLRTVHPLLFLTLMLSPLGAFWYAIHYQVSESFSQLIFQGMRNSTFDVVLYLLSGWAIWAIALWEIDGLFFGPKDEES